MNDTYSYTQSFPPPFSGNRSSHNWDQDQPARLHSQTIGKRGPIIKQDNIEHETLQTFIHEKIRERPVHVKGFGAFGYFETYYSMSLYTSLSFMQQAGTQLPVFVRFSLAVSTKGTPDTSRNVRGFSTKFYAQDGIYDLVCNHIPVFSVRDTIRFPEAIKAFLPSPENNLIDPNRFWRFVARTPESLHFVLRLYSNMGTVKSFRHIPGHSVNTYVWKNTNGERRYVKLAWFPLAGERYIRNSEAVRLAGENPDVAGQDLYDTIKAGGKVEYGLYAQIMDMEIAKDLPYDPLDDTKVWDEQQFPFLPIGKMTLNKNPDDFEEQVEKAAFSPSHLLEGVELSDDKMLQGRANIYWDSQRHRIGSEFRKVPVNQQSNWTPGDLVTSGDGRYIEGIMQRSDIEKQNDYTQPRLFFEALPEKEQEDLILNIGSQLKDVEQDLQQNVLAELNNVSPELSTRIKQNMNNER
ncbi:catalase [Shouchella miscanthi]|uniref:catalase n=1 Tax=Shouchella miscanthi TaxID=2598861 RepID=UPI00119CAD16|nr:catalase [Shouchella miscanthi]